MTYITNSKERDLNLSYLMGVRMLEVYDSNVVVPSQTSFDNFDKTQGKCRKGAKTYDYS